MASSTITSHQLCCDRLFLFDKEKSHVGRYLLFNSVSTVVGVVVVAQWVESRLTEIAIDKQNEDKP